MRVGYLRVSTEGQDVENQRHAIGICDEWVSECVSGKASWRSRKLGTLITAYLKTGDTLVVSELSRLGRSFYEIIEILSILENRKVHVISIKENFNLSDDIQSKVIAFAFSLAAEIERQLISQRTKEALSYKRSQGVILGRPEGSKDKKPRIRRKAE